MENLNYFDIGVLALLVLSLLFGLIGKAPKKIWKFLIVAGSVVFSYFFLDKVMAYLNEFDISVIPLLGAAPGTTLFAYVNSLLGDTVASLGISMDAISGLITGLLKVIVFWLLCIVSFIAFGIVGGILGSIFFGHAAKGTAVKTIGIFSVLKTAVVLVALLFPVFVLSPLVKNVDAINAFVPELASNEIVAEVQKQANESKILEFTDKLLGYGETTDGQDPLGKKATVLNYTMGEGDAAQTCYVCNDVKSLPGLIQLAGKLTASMGEEGGDPMEMITSLSDEDIMDLFSNIENSPALKETLIGVVDNMLPEGVEVDLSNVNLAEEAETFIVVKEVMAMENPAEELTGEKVTELVDAIADSGMVAALAEANPGVLDSLPEDTQDEIKDQLAEKLAAGEEAGGISQEQYDSLMKLFGTASD